MGVGNNAALDDKRRVVGATPPWLLTRRSPAKKQVYAENVAKCVQISSFEGE